MHKIPAVLKSSIFVSFEINYLKAFFSLLGLIHTRHFDAQYWDKKDIFEPWISKGQGMLSKNQGK